MPLRSIITPIKTNAGTATKTRFSAACPQILGMKLKNSINENESRKNPSRPKSIANPPKMKATGYPENNRSAKVTNITIEIYSCPTHTSASPREISSSIIKDPDIV
jgi:hypothetical protein